MRLETRAGVNGRTEMPGCLFKTSKSTHTNNRTGPSRTQRSVLMVPSGEWVQSVFSCQFESHGKHFVAPNRDYPFEGLMAHHGGENWRFLDCIGLSVQTLDGHWARLLHDDRWPLVRVNPWCVTYLYKYSMPRHGAAADEVTLALAYRLHSASPSGLVTGSVDVSFPGLGDGDKAGVTVALQPFLDLRHMFAGSDFTEHRVAQYWKGGQRVEVSRRNRTMTFFLPACHFSQFSEPEVLDWNYKLGTGPPQESPSGPGGRMVTQFVGERHQAAAFFDIRPHFDRGTNTARLYFYCTAEEECSLTVSDLERLREESERRDADQLRQIEALIAREGTGSIGTLFGRVVGLTKFRTWVRAAMRASRHSSHTLVPGGSVRRGSATFSRVCSAASAR